MKLGVRRWPAAALTLSRTFGVRGAANRGAHELRKSLGSYRPAPRHVLKRIDWEGAHAFEVDRPSLARAASVEAAIARGERVLAGEYQAYRCQWRALPRTRDEWHSHPVTGELEAGAGRPWWQVEHLDPAFGDIKDLWEPARFAWAYDLVRAYLVTKDDRFAARFHRYLAEWVEANPPFTGAHWSCGQETTIRAIALLYAEANLSSAPSWTPKAASRVAGLLAASGERINDAIAYALSQRNNHGISEATGLIALGARFRGAHPEAERWLSRGRRLLGPLIRQQFAGDGWYVQHSFTYQRLALDQCVIAARALSAVGKALDGESVRRLEASARLLAAVIDPATGTMPNHGSNDGAFVHPVTLAEYGDFRPVLTAVCATFGFTLGGDIVPDAETLAWLNVTPPRSGKPAGRFILGSSGWAAVRAGRTSVFLRAGRYTSRPGQLDELHVDVRIDGRDVVVDAGSFAYNAAPPWRNALVRARVHNGPLVDEVEPGVRGPRFLWYIWPKAALAVANDGQDPVTLIAERSGECRRTVTVRDGEVTVRDELLGDSARTLSVRWLLHPSASPEQIVIEGPHTIHIAHEGSTDGWYSPHYGERIPSHWIEVVRPGAAGTAIVTCITRRLEGAVPA